MMKKMKKLISIFIIVCLMASNLIIANASIDDLPEGFYTDFASSGDGGSGTVTETNYKSVYELLKYLNILNDDTLVPSDKATRGFAAHLFAGIISYGKLDTATEKPYSDVQLTNVYANGIYTALKYKITDEAAKFNPSKDITPEAAADMAVKVLGYTGDLEAASSLMKANSLKLFSGIDRYKEALTVGDMILMAVNTLEADRIAKTTYSNGGTYTLSETEESYLEERGIYITEGIASEVGLFSLYGTGSKISEYEIGINRKIFRTVYPVSEDLFAKAVMAYVDSEASDMIITVWENKKITETTVLAGSDLSKITETSASYENDGKTKSIKIGSGARVIENFSYYGTTNTAIGNNLLYGAPEILFIDNTGDRNVDVVHVKNYQYGVVDKVMTSTELVAFKFGKPSAKLKDDEGSVIIRKNGEKITISDIKPNDVFKMLTATENGISKYIIDVNTDAIVSEFSGERNKGSKIIFDLEGTEYELTSDYASFYKTGSDPKYPNPRLGKSASFFITSDGKIAGVSLSNVYTYGYLMGAVADGVFDKTCQIKVYNTDSTLRIYDLADKVELYTPPTASGGAFTVESATPEEVYNALRDESGNYKVEMIAYTLNSDGKVNSLAPEFVNISNTVTPTSYPLVKNFATGLGGSPTRYYYRVLGNLFYLSESAPKISVPLTDDNSIRVNEDYYSKYTVGTDIYYGANVLSVYNVSSTYVASFAVYKAAATVQSEKLSGYEKTVMVKDKYQTLDSKGDPVSVLECVDNNKIVTLEFSSDTKLSGEAEGSVPWVGAPSDINDINIGDVIQYNLDGLGKVGLIRVLFNEDNRGSYRSQAMADSTGIIQAPTNGRPFAVLAVSYGRVVLSDNGNLVVCLSNDGDSKYNYPFFILNTRQSVHGPNTYTLYDSAAGTVTSITKNDIVEGDEVVLRSDYPLVVNAFVYR